MPTTIRKRPEFVTLPEVPTILKLSEVPTGTYLLRINLPFTMTHLAKAGVKRTWIMARTGKSVMTLLGEDTAKLDQLRKAVQEVIYFKYPTLRRHFRISVVGHLQYGANYTQNPEGQQSHMPWLHYIPDVPAFMQIMDECGFSDIPIMMFSVILDHPTMVITFRRHAHYKGFIATQFDRSPYNFFNVSQLSQLIQNNPILQNMKCHICQTNRAEGVFETCVVPSEGHR